MTGPENQQESLTEKKHIFDNPKNVKRVIWALYISCAVVFAGDFFIHRHVDHPWESMFGFYGIYAFTSFCVLVLGAKEMRKLVMRKEDYYDK